MSDAQVQTAEAPTVAPEKGTEEYNQMMSERMEQGFRPDVEKQKQSFEVPTEISPMPENGVEKFYNKETGDYAWDNHAKELQYRLDQQADKQPATEETQESAPEQGQKQFDWNGLSESMAQNNNELSVENRKSLNDFGIPDEIIDSYLSLQGVGLEFAQQRTMEYAGGEEKLNAMFDWATKNLPEEEVKNYNDILDSPNWRMAIDSLSVASGFGGNSTESPSGSPELVEGSSAVDSGVGFSSKVEMVKAMSDPRYKQDPAFRNQVRLKVSRSNF